MPSDDIGSVVTVDGRIDPDQLGVTITHEHIFVDLSNSHFEPPESAAERAIAREPVSMDNLWYVHRRPGRHKDNMQLNSMDVAREEVARYHRHGGDTIVDVTPKNLGGDPEAVRSVARETGVTFIHGTAYYTQVAHPDRIKKTSVEELTAEFVSDVQEGIDDTDVRAGIIGELGVSGQIYDAEEKVLRAGARASLRTGAPVNVHPPGWQPEEHREKTYSSSRWATEILDVLEDEGLPPERVVFSHMDRPEFEFNTLEYQRQLADRGAFLEYDMWGAQFYNDDAGMGYPSDTQRIDAITQLVDDGYASNLLFSQDVAVKIQLTKYGGFGYSHVVENVVSMLRTHGISQTTIDKILVENPKRSLTFAPA